MTLYFNNAVDYLLGTLGNWWQDDAFTIPADSLPSSSDDIVVGPAGVEVRGITGNDNESVTYKSLVATDSVFWAGGPFDPPYSYNFEIITTDGITSSGCLFLNKITSDGEYNACVFTEATDFFTGAIVDGNSVLRNCTAVGLHNYEDPIIFATFTGNVDAYFPTLISDGAGATLHGYTPNGKFNFAPTIDNYLGHIGNWYADEGCRLFRNVAPTGGEDNVVINNSTVYGWDDAGTTPVFDSLVCNNTFFLGGYFSDSFSINVSNGITANNCQFYIGYNIVANGTYTDCSFVEESDYYTGASVIGNSILHNCVAITSHGSDSPVVSSFTGNVDAYWPTTVASGLVSGTLNRYGYTLRHTTVRHCHLDETSGTRYAFDLYEEEGIPVGYGAGLFKNAARFDGNSLINGVAEHIAQFSISVWVNFATSPSVLPQSIVGTGAIYGHNFTIYAQTGKLFFYIDGLDGGTIEGPTITIESWYHCVVTVTPNLIRFYVNGVQMEGNIPVPMVNSGGFALSKFYGANPLFDDALVDELNTFNVDLTPAQVLELYNGGVGLAYPFSTGKVKKIDLYKLLGIPSPSLDFKYNRLLNLPFFVKI